MELRIEGGCQMVDVERTMQFPVSPDELWDALTDPALLREWFAASDAGDGGIDVDLRPGGTMLVTDGDDERLAVVEEVEPGRRLTFTWTGDDRRAGSHVELDVSEHDGGSELRVRESLVEVADRVDATDIADRAGAAGSAAFAFGFQPPRRGAPRALARA
jgi:uncharacterized protein YndB with AHSA1/START domain